MYRIIGVDGKEYGPIEITQVRQWVADGRINARTKIKEEGANEWKVAGDIPDLKEALSMQAGAGPSAPPPPLPPPPVPGEEKGLAITSLVLGILSMVCFGFLTGIPAVICGHVARGRVRRSPGQYGG